MDTKKLRQKILDLAIHGKLVPQDPNDEPASVLLERIHAEKERLIKKGKIKQSKKSAKSSDTPHYENRQEGEANEVPFEVPESWEWCRFATIAKFLNGDRSKNYPNKSEYVLEGMPWINTGHITPLGYLSTKKMNYISLEKYQSLSGGYIEKGDLVYCLRGATYGKVARVEPYEMGAIASSLLIIRPIITEIREYVYYYLNTQQSKYQLNIYANGAAQPNLAAKDVEKYLIPLPPLAEQLRIVAAIKKWFTLIDTLESAKEDLQTSITQAKSKILDLAIHGKLVPQDPNDEPAIELLKRINPKFTPCDNAHYENVPFEIPKSWEWTKIGRVCEVARGGSPRPIKDYITKDADGINWIKIGDTNKNGKYINSAQEKIKSEGKRKSRYVHKGDFLLTNSMSYGHPYILNIDGCIHDGWLVLSPIGNAFTTDFLYYLLSSGFIYEQFSDAASGGVVSNLNSDKVADTTIPLPPYNEQQRIVTKIEELFAVLDEIQNNLVS